MMDDKELHKLKALTPPPPSDAARRQAFQAAFQAFEDAADHQVEKNKETRQGFRGGVRLIHSFNQKLWSFIMKERLIAGTAIASVLAVMVTTGLWQRGELTLPTPEHNAATPQAEPSPPLAEDHPAPEPTAAAPQEKPAARPAMSPPRRMSETKELSSAGSAPPQPDVRVDTHATMAPTQNYEAIAPMAEGDQLQGYVPGETRNKFAETTSNPVKITAEEPVSTLSIDVDTASYAFVRNALNTGHLPPTDAVRVEEMINYFDYDYPLPDTAEQPFKPTVSVYPTPWNKDTKLLAIGIKGLDIVPEQKPRSNLVFLLDVSGSMNDLNKLPLLKNAFRMMVDNLSPEDTVSIVTYAGNAGTVLEPTRVADKARILSALQNLQAGGSTAGAEGIEQAYALAEQNFDKTGVNRVILATDGDFNVGITDPNQLKDYIERKRDTGIYLSVLGFGHGNYNDALMQELAQNGNGNAAYIDTLNEARKVLVDEASSTLFPIAKDVKIQIEFNPDTVAEYRLIGYETRLLNREDFNNDKVDAGDIGSGHTVTAIYEITPVGSKAQLSDNLRYQSAETKAATSDSDEYAFLKIRYKLPDQDTSKLIEMPIDKSEEKDSLSQVSQEIQFATSVAAFGQLLRNESNMGDFSYDDVIALAQGARGEDLFGYRSEFMNLVRLAKSAEKM